MLAYIIRRLVWTPFVLIAVSFITFTVGHYGPGDPVQVLMGQKNDPEIVDRVRRERGLDRPFWEQYVGYVIGAPKEQPAGMSAVEYVFHFAFSERHPDRQGVIRGDFGESYKFLGQKVSDLIFSRVWVSVQLGSVALGVGVIIGMMLGLAAALNQGRWFDPVIVSGGLFLSSLPVFIVQPLLAFLLSRQLHLLPSSGWDSGVLGLGIFSPKIIMPALILSLGPIGGITRLMRSSTLEVVNQDYVRTARSKGLGERAVRINHIGRNAVLPIFTVVGLSLASLVEGGFISETLFGIPGIGRLAVESFFARDYPVIMAMTLLVAASYIIVNLLIDIGYTFLDPRITLG
ncbi:MAG: ABC transporter permease [Chloroflexi bacterium]|nr:ABC transporter permease [Chloroflexota bacterium]